MGKREPLWTVGLNVKWHSHCGKQHGVPQKIKNRATIWPSNTFLGIYPKEMKSRSGNDICSSVFTAALFTISKIWKQPKGLYKEGNPSICDNLDGSSSHYAKWDKSGRER